MKQVIQSIIRPFGYRFQRLDTRDCDSFAPFIRDFNLPDASFRMWMANADDVDWYEESWATRYEFCALKGLIQRGDRIIDIGSHHGFLAMLFAKWTGETGFVLGVESNPNNVLIDHAQLSLNHFNNLKFIHAAASANKGTLTINHDHNGSVCRNGSGITVEALPCDILDEQYGPFNVLKIDVEGYEVQALRGCKNILSRSPKLALELHIDQLLEQGQSVDDVFDLVDIGKYTGTMIVRPLHSNKKLPFDPCAVRKLKKGTPYCAVNAFLTAK